MPATMKAPRAEKRLGCGYWGVWKGEQEHREPSVLVRARIGRKRKKTISEAKTKLQVAGLKTEVARMKKELRRKPYITTIASLAPHPFQVLQPIYVVIRKDDEAYVASFADANVNASGETEQEAYEILKDSLVSAFCVLSDNESDLGLEPQRQLAVLREFIREK